MRSWIDGSLYPDRSVPRTLRTLDDRVDFLARLCAQWDFGVLPEAATIREIRRKPWRRAVQACEMFTSPAYHLLRSWHQLPPEPYWGDRLPHIADDPCLTLV